jgi:threonine/homoserine/homoserine lactone efflux protein
VPSPHTIALFMASALALNLTPGPAILFILSRSFGQGRAAAVVSVFGLATASVIQAVAAAFGLSALFVYSPLAFAIVKYCGAAYLVYLGIAGFLSGGLAGVAGPAETGRRRSLANAYWQGLLTDLLNPKLLLFFFSFLPQFVDPARGEPSLQMLVLGLLFQVTVCRPIWRWRSAVGRSPR